MKKTFHLFIFLLIAIMLLSVFITYGCSMPASASATETQAENVPVTTPVTAPAAATTTVSTPTSLTAGEVHMGPSTQPLLGYWEVEDESKKDSANEILGINGVTFNIVELRGSILYAFYAINSNEEQTGPYRMDTWGTDIYISTAQGSNRIEIWMDYVLTGDITSTTTPGQFLVRPIREVTNVDVNKIAVNGYVVTSGAPIDLGDLVLSGGERTIAWNTLTQNRISLQDVGSGNRPFFLNRTTQTTHVPNTNNTNE
jgi:hypothetical protein